MLARATVQVLKSSHIFFQHSAPRLRLRASSSRPATAMASVSTWAKEDRRRFLHATMRTTQADAMVNYYTKFFGMRLQRSFTDTEGRVHHFVGYGPEDQHFQIDFVSPREGEEAPVLGNGFGHWGLALKDVYAATAAIKSQGGRVTREAGPVKGGTTVIAFAQDPDQLSIELIQREGSPEPLCQVMLRVGDLQRSIAFYRDVLGMELSRVRQNPEYKYDLGFVSYGPEMETTVVELTYNYGVTSYNSGDKYGYLALSTTDVAKTAEDLKQHGAVVTRGPSPLPGTSIQSVETQDPDGWRIVFLDEKQLLAAASK